MFRCVRRVFFFFVCVFFGCFKVCAHPKESGVLPNAVLYGGAIRACSVAGKWRVGVELLEVTDWLLVCMNTMMILSCAFMCIIYSRGAMIMGGTFAAVWRGAAM